MNTADPPTGFGDVFIIGAGFSRAISGQMPLLPELSGVVAARLSPDAWFHEVPFLSSDVELAMTFLSQPQPWISESKRLRNRALYLEMTEAIAAEIAQRSSNVLDQPIPEWLLRLVHWMHFQRATVITLNYDTLLESAIAAIPGGPYPRLLIPFQFAADGTLTESPRNSLRLLKLHGSVNWRYSGRSSYAGELIHWSGVRIWGEDGAGPTRESSGDLVPLIVPPVADKGAYFAHHSVQHLWRNASEALKNANRVFCVGYSLPATDLTMRFLLSDVQRRDPLDFYLVNLPQSKKHYEDMLPTGQFRLKPRFVCDDPIRSLTSALFDEEFFSTYLGTVNRIKGPVETAIRQRIQQGERIPTPITNGFAVLDGFDSVSVRFRLDDAEIPICVPWEALESVLDLAYSVNLREFGSQLRYCCDRDLSKWIAGIFERAKLARTWWCVNRWVVSRVGHDDEEAEASRNAYPPFPTPGYTPPQ